MVSGPETGEPGYSFHLEFPESYSPVPAVSFRPHNLPLRRIVIRHSLPPMKRRITIVPLLAIMLIASIGMPVNVHSCRMADFTEKAPSCGMCASSHADEDDGRGCCDNRLEIERGAPATTAKSLLAIDAPPVVAILSWPVFSVELPQFNQIVTHPANGPPPGVRSLPSWLLFSSFLL